MSTKLDRNHHKRSSERSHLGHQHLWWLEEDACRTAILPPLKPSGRLQHQFSARFTRAQGAEASTVSANIGISYTTARDDYTGQGGRQRPSKWNRHFTQPSRRRGRITKHHSAGRSASDARPLELMLLAQRCVTVAPTPIYISPFQLGGDRIHGKHAVFSDRLSGLLVIGPHYGKAC
ncbi:hypothetical protein BT67DRAFT_46934 [Trichocladium antarcticum]|uniref:Uncharacterized protein n=1 Tax=Trichocladium antarcticum TaxID=1450529 RepID=A0AAN6ZCX9_9PEZI|nr:hypothetical protein BT67DRAFT_46934 [Trichocladium antarcticum]